MDTRKDLLKLYHPSRQTPKEVAAASEVVMDAMYWNGAPAGSYSAAFKRYKYKLPSGIVVYGDNDYSLYRFKGGDPKIKPESDTYTDGVGIHWVKLTEGCV